MNVQKSNLNCCIFDEPEDVEPGGCGGNTIIWTLEREYVYEVRCSDKWKHVGKRGGGGT
jgi:hypothetical protein